MSSPRRSRRLAGRDAPPALHDASAQALAGAVGRARTRVVRRQAGSRKRGRRANEPVEDVTVRPSEVVRPSVPGDTARRSLETGLPYDLDAEVVPRDADVAARALPGTTTAPERKRRGRPAKAERRIQVHGKSGDGQDEDELSDDAYAAIRLARVERNEGDGGDGGREEESEDEDEDGWEENVEADATAAAAVAASLAADAALERDKTSKGQSEVPNAVDKVESQKSAEATALRLLAAQTLNTYRMHVICLCAMQLRMDTTANDEHLQALALSLVPRDAMMSHLTPSIQTLRRFVLWFRLEFQREVRAPESRERLLCSIAERAEASLASRRGQAVDLAVIAAAAVRAMGVRCRLVVPMQPMLFKVTRAEARFYALARQGVVRGGPRRQRRTHLYAWLEVFIGGRWRHVDALNGLVDATTVAEVISCIRGTAGDEPMAEGTPRGRKARVTPDTKDKAKEVKQRGRTDDHAARPSWQSKFEDESTLTHVVAVEDGVLSDVTRRYVASWKHVQRERPPNGLFEKTLALSCGRKASEARAPRAQPAPPPGPRPASPASSSSSSDIFGTSPKANKKADSSKAASSEATVPVDRALTKSLNATEYVAADPALASEQREFDTRALKEDVPTTISALKTHPVYVIERHLKKYEVVYPREPILGHAGAKKEPVFLRSHVRTLHTKDRWIREMREVVRGSKPIKTVKSKTRRDGEETVAELFGDWQTDELIIPPVEDGIVPKNSRGNVDLWSPKHLPAGSVHVNLSHAASCARSLGIDYAPCMTGFEIRSGRSVPRLEGIVVAIENEEIVRDAALDAAHRAAERAEKRDREEALGMWKELFRRIEAREKVSKRYGSLLDSTKPSSQTLPKKRRAAKDDTAEEGDSAAHDASNNDDPGTAEKRQRKGSVVDAHDHVFDDGQHQHGDIWIKTCTLCGIEVAFEKL